MPRELKLIGTLVDEDDEESRIKGNLKLKFVTTDTNEEVVDYAYEVRDAVAQGKVVTDKSLEYIDKLLDKLTVKIDNEFINTYINYEKEQARLLEQKEDNRELVIDSCDDLYSLRYTIDSHGGSRSKLAKHIEIFENTDIIMIASNYLIEIQDSEVLNKLKKLNLNMEESNVYLGRMNK